MNSRDRNDEGWSSADANPRVQFDGAFTLIEVMLAAGIFFMCIFIILAVVAGGLRNARALQQHRLVDATMVAAELSLTNRLVEGKDSGDFGDLYPEYRWERDINLAGTNGLFQVDFAIYRRSFGGAPESQMSILLFRPDSPAARGGGAGGVTR